MAVFLVLALIATIKTDAGVVDALWLLLRQVGFGSAIGLAGAWAVAWLLRKLPLTVEHGAVQ